MRRIITIPEGLFRYTTFSWRIDWRNQAAGDFTDGTTNTAFAGFPRWVGSPSIVLHNDDLLRWRAVRNMAQGRIGIFRVRIVDVAGWDDNEMVPDAAWLSQGVPFAGGNVFANGLGWQYEPFALAAGPASRGATEVDLDMSPVGGVAPRQGQIMSHDDWPFSVSWVQPMGDSIYRVGVQMPLRADISAGDFVLMRGTGRFEATEADMGSEDYDLQRVARPALQFTEVLRR